MEGAEIRWGLARLDAAVSRRLLNVTTPTAIVYRQAVQLTVHSTLTTSIRFCESEYVFPSGGCRVV
jgi:hypothetical protein